MAKLGNLSGSPWHTEKMVRKEGDPRRHRSKCIFYSKDSGYCTKQRVNCIGSAHCKYYDTPREPKPEKTQKPVEVTRPPVVMPQKKEETVVKPFSGVKMIPMKDICLGHSSFTKPAEKKIRKIIQYYQTHGTLDKPVVVSCSKSKYILQDKFLRYYVALELGLKEIPARIGEYKEQSIDELIRRGGQRVRHSTYGPGVVERSSLTVVEIRFDSGYICSFDITFCLELGVFELI